MSPHFSRQRSWLKTHPFEAENERQPEGGSQLFSSQELCPQTQRTWLSFRLSNLVMNFSNARGRSLLEDAKRTTSSAKKSSQNFQTRHRPLHDYTLKSFHWTPQTGSVTRGCPGGVRTGLTSNLDRAVVLRFKTHPDIPHYCRTPPRKLLRGDSRRHFTDPQNTCRSKGTSNYITPCLYTYIHTILMCLYRISQFHKFGSLYKN